MNLDLMLLIDKQFLDTPFYGVRQMTWHLQKSEGPWPQWGRVSPPNAAWGSCGATAMRSCRCSRRNS